MEMRSFLTGTLVLSSMAMYAVGESQDERPNI